MLKKMKQIPNLLLNVLSPINRNKLLLTGVTGGRLDHSESALHLLYRLQIENPTYYIFDSQLRQMNFQCFFPAVHKLFKNNRLSIRFIFSFWRKGDRAYVNWI